MKKRKIEVLVLSDIHLGAFDSKATELFNYLNSVKPEIIVLNGDILDIREFRKSFFPKSHLRVLKKLIDFATKGTEVYYISGNHDDFLRKFCGTSIANFHILDKLVLELDDKKAWIFHGDVFDISVKHSKWIVKMGGIGYSFLIQMNRFVNWCLVNLKKEPYSLSYNRKSGFKRANEAITDFEQTVSDIAIEKNYDYVICGHLHEPKISRKENKNGAVLYLNSGDWLENLTALEYNKKRWKLYCYSDNNYTDEEDLFEMEDHLTNQLIASIIFTKDINHH